MKWVNKGHEFDKIGYLLKEKRNIYIYGAGAFGREICEVITACNEILNWKIIFVDQNEKKQKEGFCDKIVISPNELIKSIDDKGFIVVCANKNNTEEIVSGLQSDVLKLNENIFTYKYFLYTYLSIHFIYNHNLVFFTSENILKSTVCNLNCKNCLNFNPFIKKHCIDSLDDFKSDIDLFFKNVDLIYRFQITGGEPFLDKDICEVYKYIYEKYREKIIRLETVTNGTIVPSDELCRVLKECNVYVFLDDYRMSVSNGDTLYKMVEDKFKKFEINYIDNHVDIWMDLAPLDTNNSSLSEKELENYFESCGNPWSTLRNGKITSCNYAHYAEKAELISYDDNNYLDLKDINKNNKKELIEFRLRFNKNGYTEFCKSCSGWSDINKNPVKPAIQVERKY